LVIAVEVWFNNVSAWSPSNSLILSMDIIVIGV